MELWKNDSDQVLVFRRGDLVFVFNWSPDKSLTDYAILAPEGEYKVVLDSDSTDYGGFGNIDDKVHHFTKPDPLYSPDGKGWLRLYLPARTAQVLEIVKNHPSRTCRMKK